MEYGTQLQRIAGEIQTRMETWVDEYGDETTVKRFNGDWEAYIGKQHMHVGLAPEMQRAFGINIYLQPREAIIGASVVISERKLVAYWVCDYEDPETCEESSRYVAKW